jgi:MoaA/NifB/PqqE/SkfB family radical SAM enzyme
MDDDYFLGFNTQFGIELLSGINGNPDPFMLKLPSLLDIGIMGHCTNKCNICYQGDKYEDHMDISDFIKIIDQVKHHTTQVALGGRGDPNKHPEFDQFVMYARRNGVIPNYTTSGIGLTQDEVDLTKEYCGAVAVSNYDQDYTYEALNRFINAGMKTNIHYVYTRESFREALGIVKGEDIWEGKFNLSKLNAVIFLLFKRKGRATNLVELDPTYYQLALLCSAIREFANKSSFKIGMDSCLVNYYYDIIANLTEEEKLSLDTCEAARMSAYISPSLIMTPCSFCNEENGESLKDKSIEEVWKNSVPFMTTREVLRTKRNSCPAKV